MTAAWQQGKLTNLDYLLFCNLAAGRSFNDLTQWPIFPWILADYTSAILDLSDPSTYRQVKRPPNLCLRDLASVLLCCSQLSMLLSKAVKPSLQVQSCTCTMQGPVQACGSP